MDPTIFDDERLRSEHLLTVVDVVDILHVSRSSVYLLIARGELACLRIGRTLRFRPREVESYIVRREKALDLAKLAAAKPRPSGRKKPR